MSDNRAKPRERTVHQNVRRSYFDGVSYSAMVGMGETYLPAFALAIGLNQVIAGLVSTVPLVTGGILQLAAPSGVRWLRSYRKWVVFCAFVQASCFIPLIVAALVGAIPAPLLFLIAGLYWGAAMAGGAAWNCWIEELIPPSIRTKFLATRTRLMQFFILCGFVGGGHLLWYAARQNQTLYAFAILFSMAMLGRYASAFFLFRQSETPTTHTEMKTVAFSDLLTRMRKGDQATFLLYMVCMQLAVNMASPYFNPYMLKQLNLSYLDYITLIGVAYVGRVISLPTLGRLSNYLGANRLLWITGIGIAPLSGAWVLSSDMLYLTIMQLISGICWGGFELAGLLLIFQNIRPHERTSILTMHNLAHTLAVVIGSLIGGAILESFNESLFGFQVIFVLSTGMRLLPLLILVRAKYKDTPLRMIFLRTVGLRASAGVITQPMLPDMSEHSDKTDGDKNHEPDPKTRQQK